MQRPIKELIIKKVLDNNVSNDDIVDCAGKIAMGPTYSKIKRTIKAVENLQSIWK